MSGPVKVITKRFVNCLAGCAHEFEVEHLFARDYKNAGPWYCDVCGVGWMLSVNGDAIEMKDSGKSTKRHFVTLEIQPQALPVVLTLDYRIHTGFTEENVRYLFEEHTCPVNWFRDVVGVAIGDDTDPHGLFKVVRVSGELAPGEEWEDHQ